MRQAVREVVAALRALPTSAAGIESPLTSPGLTSASPGKPGSALVTFNVAGKPDNDDTAVVPALNAVAAVQAHHPGLKVEEAGDASVDRAIGSITGNDFRKAEVTSIPVSLVLLLVVFGALIAAGIPLLLAGTAVISAISLLAIPGRWLPIDSTTSSIVLLVGMAVGIDYSLFYLRRTREERAAGRGTAEALRIAAHTSGRAIVVSGLTVMIALAGLFLTGIDVFSGVAIGTILVVGVAVLGSLTFLPAILSMLGPWTDRGRIPFLGRRRTAARESKFFGACWPAPWSGARWPGAASPPSCCWRWPRPRFRLNLEDPGIHSLPPDVPVVHSLADISQAFPGGPVPAEVVVTSGAAPISAGSRSAGPSPRCTGRWRARTAPSASRSAPRCSGTTRCWSCRCRWRAAGPTPRPTTRWPRCGTTPCPPRWARCRGSATRWRGSPRATTISTRSWLRPCRGSSYSCWVLRSCC